MTRLALKPEANPAPPPIAAALVGCMTPPRLRDALLGDLAEEFESRVTTSPAGARFWYWAQVVRSVPPLAWLNVQRLGMRTAGLAVGMSLLGWISIGYWDVHVSRQSASMIASQIVAPDMMIVRTVYFFVQSVGMALVSAAIASFSFRSHWRFARNSAVFLGPISLAFLVSGGMTAISTQQYLYAGLRVAIAWVALALGAYAVVYCRRSVG